MCVRTFLKNGLTSTCCYGSLFYSKTKCHKHFSWSAGINSLHRVPTSLPCSSTDLARVLDPPCPMRCEALPVSPCSRSAVVRSRAPARSCFPACRSCLALTLPGCRAPRSCSQPLLPATNLSLSSFSCYYPDLYSSCLIVAGSHHF